MASSCTAVRNYSPFQSIPATMYWCLTTQATVGYGDIYPVTPLGKFFGAMVVLLGVMSIALPVSVIGNVRLKRGGFMPCPAVLPS